MIFSLVTVSVSLSFETTAIFGEAWDSLSVVPMLLVSAAITAFPPSVVTSALPLVMQPVKAKPANAMAAANFKVFVMDEFMIFLSLNFVGDSLVMNLRVDSLRKHGVKPYVESKGQVHVNKPYDHEDLHLRNG